MSVHVVSWAWKQRLGDPGLKIVLVKLADNSDDDGYSWWGQKRLAEECEMSRATVQRKLTRLVERGYITVEERTNGRNNGRGSNGYRVHPPPQTEAAPASSVEAAPASTVRQQEPSREPLRETLFQRESESPPTAASEEREAVAQAWLVAPGMTQHRPAYFADGKMRQRITKAIKKYGVEDVASAITAYATVYSSPDYRWEHRWTFGEFLDRGLDRFVPEAEPLKRYAYREDEKPKPTADFSMYRMKDQLPEIMAELEAEEAAAAERERRSG